MGLLRRMPLLDRSPVIGGGRIATQGHIVGCLPEDFPSAPRPLGSDMMMCDSYPEFFLDYFQMVPLLIIMLTSSVSLLLSCFPHVPVDVLSSAAVRISGGQIQGLGCPSTHACTFNARRNSSLISFTFPAAWGVWQARGHSRRPMRVLLRV